MRVAVLGCGRWGSFHAWYAQRIGHQVMLWGREGSAHLKVLRDTRQNEYLTMPEDVELTDDLARAVEFGEVLIISISSQKLREFCGRLKELPNLGQKKFVLAHTIRLRPAHPEEQAEVQVCEAAPTAAAEILATVCEADRDYETYVEGSGPAPDWYRPWEPMCAEWSAVDGSVDKTVDDSVDDVTDVFVGDIDVLCNAEPHPPVGIDPGGVDWNICSTLWGWDGHTMEIWEMDLFARIMYLEFWGTSRTCCEAGADSILRLWESGYFGRTIFETLSAVSESGALVYTTYGFVWDVEYDPAGLSEMRELCEERFSHGPEWYAPFFQLYEYPSWATPCYEIDGVFFSTSPWLEG